jgi:hypothetical protein
MSMFFCSCATIGTVTLYKTDQPIVLKKIGFSQLVADSITTVIYPQTSKIWRNTIFELFIKYEIDSIKEMVDFIQFDNPDTSQIIEKCKENNLDGLLISKLNFFRVTYSVYFVPITQNYDTKVNMKLFDKNGNLLLSTVHDTFSGNSYWLPPSAETTVRDGTKGALGRVIKEMGLQQK